MCIHVYMSACKGPKLTLGVFLTTLHIIYEARTLTERGAHQFLIAWLASLPWRSLSASQTQSPHLPDFYVSSGNLNSRLHTCGAVALSTELSSPVLNFSFFNIYSFVSMYVSMSVSMYMRAHMHTGNNANVEVRKQLVVVTALPPPCGSQDLAPSATTY